MAVTFVITNQRHIPHTKSPLWDQLAACKVHTDYRKGEYSIILTQQVQAMDGKSIIADGFMLPLESTPHFTHFLLSKRSPTCPYCPPGAPNEIIEVFTRSPMEWSDQLVSMRGTMQLVQDKNAGIFFQMRNAVLEQ